MDRNTNLQLQGGMFHENVGGDMVLVLCTPSDDGLHMYHICKHVFRINTMSILNITKEYNSNNNIGGVNAYLFLCIADDALYLYKILPNTFNTYKVIKWIQLPYFK